MVAATLPVERGGYARGQSRRNARQTDNTANCPIAHTRAAATCCCVWAARSPRAARAALRSPHRRGTVVPQKLANQRRRTRETELRRPPVSRVAHHCSRVFAVGRRRAPLSYLHCVGAAAASSSFLPTTSSRYS